MTFQSQVPNISVIFFRIVFQFHGVFIEKELGKGCYISNDFFVSFHLVPYPTAEDQFIHFRNRLQSYYDLLSFKLYFTFRSSLKSLKIKLKFDKIQKKPEIDMLFYFKENF